MKTKNMMFFMLLATTLFGKSGEDLFNQNCSECHASVLGITNDGGYENSYITPAPYVADLVDKLKKETQSREKFAEFIKEYIQNPNKRKTLYGRGAIKKFGLMPSLKGAMSDKEIVNLTNFLYEYNIEKITEKKEQKKIVKKITHEEELFNKNCSSCHAKILGITNNGGYDNSYITPAPYVTDLISKLKQETDSKEKFVEFIKEYIQDPNKRKTLYGKKAIKKFGLMPSLKGVMSEEEIIGLANFLYENY
jgi:mono/diheme cytochrome c family protein